MFHQSTSFFAIALTLATTVVASGADLYFPSAEDWERVDNAAEVADPAALERAVAFAHRKHSKGVVILWRGRILAERYWDGGGETTTHSAYSVSKSYVSTLIGMAIEDGAIRSVAQPAADFLPEWKGSPGHEAITIRDLLSMTSGLEGGKRVFVRGLMARDQRRFATELEVEHRPGTRWDYHNSAYRLLFSILEEATSESLQAYTERKLVHPLGMKATRWEEKRRLFRDNQYTYLRTTVRDAARYGLFVLAEGAVAEGVKRRI